MALLACLVSRRGRGVSRDKVMALLWPDADAGRARRLLSDTIYQVRRELGDTALSAQGPDLRLDATAVSSDVADFEQALAGGRLEDAVSLYAGAFLDGFHVDDSAAFEHWLDAERDRLARAYANALQTLAGERETAGDLAAAAGWWRRLASHDPSSTRVALGVMRALSAAGDRAGAIAHARAHAAVLRDQFDMEPDDEVTALADSLRSDAPTLTSDAPAPESDARARLPRAAPIPVPVAGFHPPAMNVEDGDRRAIEDASVPRARRPRRGRLRAAAVLSLVLAVGAFAIGGRLTRQVSRDVVLVADAAGDTAIGDFVAERLRQVLARSVSLTVMGRPAIDATLQRMGRSATTRLAPAIAREVALREGVKGVVRVDVLSSGDAHYLSAALVAPETGELLDSEGTVAADAGELVSAADRLADAVGTRFPRTAAALARRERLPPLTTDSLRALLKHWEGFLAFRLRGDVVRAIELAEEAIAIDPAFAQAHAHLHSYLSGQGNNDRRAERALLSAWRLRDRLTPYERDKIEAEYALRVDGDFVRAVDRYRAHIAEAKKFGPNQVIIAYVRLAHVQVLLGQLAEAERTLREAHTWFRGPYNQALLVGVLYSRGRNADARTVLSQALREFPDNPSPAIVETHWIAAQGHASRAHDMALRLDAADELPFALRTAALFDALRGRVMEAVTHLHELRDHLVERRMPGAAFAAAAGAAQLRVVAGDTTAALKGMNDFIARFSLDSLGAWGQPALLAARLYARAGETTRASELLASYERAAPREMPGTDPWLLRQARAELALARGDADAALLHLRNRHVYIARGEWFEDPFVPPHSRPQLARAWQGAGQVDSAIAVYERYLATRTLFRAELDAFELPDVYRNLAALYARRGDSIRAAQFEQRLSGRAAASGH